MLVIAYLFLIGGKPTGNADETRYFDAKWHECRKRKEGVVGRGPRAVEGASGEPVGTGGANVSTRGWCRPAGSDDEMKQTTVGLAATTASHGYVDPRCRHDTPLCIAHSSWGLCTRSRFLKLLLGLLHVAHIATNSRSKRRTT